MMNRLMAGLLLSSIAPALAHLRPITKPIAGDKFAAGSTVSITWDYQSAHPGGQDIALSVDGATWTPIASVGQNVKTYAWTVPNTPTTTARIRICQRDGQGVAGCTNAHNTQSLTTNPPGTSVYVAISQNFTIETSSSLSKPSGRIGLETGFHVNRDLGTITARFDMAEAGRVQLQVFDLQGKLVADLVDEVMSAGAQEVNSSMRGLDATQPMMIRLRAGGLEVQERLEPAF